MKDLDRRIYELRQAKEWLTLQKKCREKEIKEIDKKIKFLENSKKNLTIKYKNYKV